MSKPAALLSLQQVLRRCFQSVESNQKVWSSVLTECTPLVASLGNLAQQLRALSNVQISSSPLRSFPDLQDRLHFKLIQAVDTVLVKLNEKMCGLQSVRDAVSNQVCGAFQLYEQHAAALDVSACTQRTATTPSLADMLGWLQDAERHYRHQLVRRKALLQTLQPGDLRLLEAAPDRWASLDSPGGEEAITEMLFKVSFFMESQ